MQNIAKWFVRIDTAWPWRHQLAAAFARLHTLPPTDHLTGDTL